MRHIIESVRPEAIICANDLTARVLMRSLIAIGCRIPDDIRVVGFDDVKDARLQPLPLTTIHQPCRNIGEVAMAAMLERISSRDLPARDILLGCKLVVRASAPEVHCSAGCIEDSRLRITLETWRACCRVSATKVVQVENGADSAPVARPGNNGASSHRRGTDQVLRVQRSIR